MIPPKTYNMEVKWAQQVVALAKLNLIRGKKIAAGTLLNSIEYTIDKSTGEITFYYADEGVFVESGRRRGARMPPPGAIAKWAKEKGIPRFRDKKGRYLSNDTRTFLLSRAIAKKGIKPYPFFQDAVDQATEKLYNDLEDAIVQDIEDQLDKNISGGGGHMGF